MLNSVTKPIARWFGTKPQSSHKIIPADKVFYLRNGNHHVKLISGKAWISFEGKDLLLTAQGECQVLVRGKYPALITSADKNPVTIEIQTRVN